MADMEPKHLSFDEITELGETGLRKLLNKTPLVCLEVPMLASAQDPYDYAIDNLQVLFVGETLAPFTTKAVCRKRFEPPEAYADFEMCVSNVGEWAEWVVMIARAMRDCEYDFDFHGSCTELEEEIFDRDLRFPELADDYLANCLHGCFEDDPEFLESLYKRFPPLREGFWRSFFSHRLGYDLYVSEYAWFVPSNIDFDALLREHSGYSKPSLYSLKPASCFRHGKKIIVSNDTTMLYAPEDWLQGAISCARLLGHRENQTTGSYQLSEAGTVLAYTSGKFTFIVFCDDHFKVEAETGRELLKLSEAFSTKLRRIFGPLEARCNWGVLNDEAFEELCYDVVRRSGRFDNETIRKMGTSRSRDGGRDIQAMTLPRLGQAPKKWIIQCKFTQSEKSLGGSKVTVADVVEQFGADGFCVMTNSLIDATLYDKVEAITGKREIECQFWSRLELEPFLQENPDLFRKYFPDKGNIIVKGPK
jgi:hypothetical protein